MGPRAAPRDEIARSRWPFAAPGHRARARLPRGDARSKRSLTLCRRRPPRPGAGRAHRPRAPAALQAPRARPRACAAARAGSRPRKLLFSPARPFIHSSRPRPTVPAR
jgi:hypothetical protein